MIEAARQYGLVKGGPKVNVKRCEELLKLGRSRGFTPRQEAIQEIVAALAQDDYGLEPAEE